VLPMRRSEPLRRRLPARSPAVARTTTSTTTATVTATREAPTWSVGATSTAVVTGTREGASTRSRSRSASSTRPRSRRRLSWRSSATSTRAPTPTALLHLPPMTMTRRRRRSGTRKPPASSAFAWRPVGARVSAPWRARPMVLVRLQVDMLHQRMTTLLRSKLHYRLLDTEVRELYAALDNQKRLLK